MTTIPLTVAFIAGLVSFLSPCVLPIIPGFLAYLSGSSTSNAGTGSQRLSIFITSVFFVLGFSVVFALLGVLLNTILSGVLYSAQAWLSRIGGIIIIFFGLYLTGLIRIKFLERDHKFAVKKTFGSRQLTSFVFGAAFAAGWTPCVGAALGAILALAASQPGSAFLLLLAYAVGLGIPFLLVGLFASQADTWIQKYASKLGYLNMIFGIILILLGVLIFTEKLSLIANFSLLNSILLK